MLSQYIYNQYEYSHQDCVCRWCEKNFDYCDLVQSELDTDLHFCSDECVEEWESETTYEA